MKTFDFKKAYLNATITDEHGEVYMRPPKWANTAPGTVWRLNKAVYGLNDSGRNWWLKLNRVMQEMGYEPSNHDQALYYRRNSKTLAVEGIIMTHVDDLMVGATENEHQRFESLLQKTNLEYTKNEGSVLKFLGLIVEQNQEKKVSRNGHEYIQSEFRISVEQKIYDELEEIEDPENLRGSLSEDEEYWARAMIGKAAWLMTSIRADLTGDVSILQQEMTNDKRKDIIPKVNSLIRKALDHRGLMLTIKYMFKPQLIMYTDASYDSNTGNSQLGYMLLTKEEDDYKCNVLTWGSRKNARKTVSSTAAETHAYWLAIDKLAHALSIFWEIGMERRVKDARLMVDNFNAFTTIDNRGANGNELQLNPYFASIKRTKAAYNIMVQWTAGMKMLADPLTKRTKTKTLLTTMRKNEFQFELDSHSFA